MTTDAVLPAKQLLMPFPTQKKRQIEKLKGKGKEDVEKSKERAMQSLRNVKMQRISSTDKGATAMQKAGENLASLAGGVAGAKYGAKNQKAALGALTGGMAGLVSGQVGGNIIEQERRRRNSVENELESGNAEMYLR